MGRIRIPDSDWSANLWSRVKTLFSGLDTRVTALEQGGGGGGGAVSGVKGDAESTYRTGQVNLTAANVGAVDADDVANDLTTTAAGKVLDARQGKALNDAIAGMIPSQVFTISASASKVLTLANNTRCLLFGVNNGPAYFVELVYCTATGATYNIPVMTANRVTITTASDNTLTIANGSARALPCGVLILAGSVTA